MNETPGTRNCARGIFYEKQNSLYKGGINMSSKSGGISIRPYVLGACLYISVAIVLAFIVSIFINGEYLGIIFIPVCTCVTQFVAAFAAGIATLKSCKGRKFQVLLILQLIQILLCWTISMLFFSGFSSSAGWGILLQICGNMAAFLLLNRPKTHTIRRKRRYASG